jgi:predicted RNA binding protein YcfA (HicA-like mRNA interferase family)
LRPVKAEILIKALAMIGFQPVRQRGSHIIMKHPDGRSTVIPVHPGEELGRGILMEIMSDVGLNKKEFLDLLERLDQSGDLQAVNKSLLARKQNFYSL